MKLSGVRPSVGLSVRPITRPPLQWVCCCGPGGQETSIDCCTTGAQQQMRAVPRRQLTSEAELRFVIFTMH